MAARPWETAYLDDNEENPKSSIKQDSLENNTDAEDNKLEKQQPSAAHEALLDDPSSSSSSSIANLQPQHLSSVECVVKSSTVASPMSNVKQESSILKQNKSSPSRGGSGMQKGSLEVRGETAVGSVDKSTVVISNGGQTSTELPRTEQTSKSNNRLMSKSVINRRSLSGPLKGMYESSFLGSPAVPSYMAATQSAKAKTRSQSNPKSRPEAEDKTSPISKRRQSLPTESKQNPIPWRTFRSSSTKGFSSAKPSRPQGGA